MENDRIWILFARRVSGEITPEESRELEVLIREQPEHQYSMDILQRYLESGRKFGNLADEGISTRDASAAR